MSSPSSTAPGAKAATRPAYDVERVRRDFPALRQEVHGHPLAYLDNAATAQKPQAVLDALRGFYEGDCANVHRGVHTLSVRATEKYEAARQSVRRLLGAGDTKEVIFLRGATEGINLVAQSYGRPRLQAGDEILITWMEHHSNIVPWQLLCQQTGAVLKVAPILDDGSLDMAAFEALLSERTRIVAASHVSNALGTVNDARRIVELAHAAGAVALFDGAQAAPHLTLDVRALGCDFYVISGHKMYGPTGIGALYGRRELLDAMPPYQGGGEMIRSVSFEGTTYNDLPHRFEAGTPHIAGAIGLGAAADYLESLDLELAAAHEHAVLEHATKRLSEIDEVRFIGTAPGKAAVLSFAVEGVHAHDVGTILDHDGVAVRAGHHCAQPVMDRFGVSATARASFGIYNTLEEADRLVDGIQNVLEMFR